jgi:hypothetical protein
MHEKAVAITAATLALFAAFPAAAQFAKPPMRSSTANRPSS